jgi:hypothetical protein
MSGQKHVKEIFSGALQKKKQVLEQKPAKPWYSQNGCMPMPMRKTTVKTGNESDKHYFEYVTYPWHFDWGSLQQAAYKISMHI